jgi:hypothetical protein
MRLSSEPSAVQNPLIHYAVEAGWTYLRRHTALRLRRGEADALLQAYWRRCSSGSTLAWWTPQAQKTRLGGWRVSTRAAPATSGVGVSQVWPLRRTQAGCSSRGRLTFDEALLLQQGEFRAEAIVPELVQRCRTTVLFSVTHAGFFGSVAV